MKSRDLFKLTIGLLLTVFLSVVFASIVEVPASQVLTFLLMLGLVLTAVRFMFLLVDHSKYGREVTGILSDVSTEFWDNIIAKNLYRGYEWATRAKNRNNNVLSNKVVHIPQAGAVPTVRRNRQAYPISAVKRSDTDITYVIDELSSDTTLVNEAEKWELSYTKIPDVLDDHIKEIGKRAAQNLIYRWLGLNPGGSNLAAANIVRTTGANTGHLLTTATGTRLRLLVADVATALTILKTQTKKDLNSGKRALILTLESYNELRSDAVLDNSQKYDTYGAVFKDGELVKLYGLDIIITDVMPRFTNATPPLAKDPLDVSVVAAATDNDVSAVIDFDYVHRAQSEVKMFYQADAPEWQGDIMNALARVGGSRERADQAGVVAIVQA